MCFTCITRWFNSLKYHLEILYMCVYEMDVGFTPFFLRNGAAQKKGGGDKKKMKTGRFIEPCGAPAAWNKTVCLV